VFNEKTNDDKRCEGGGGGGGVFLHQQKILGKLVCLFEKLVHRITADKRYALCAMDLETRTDPNSSTLIKCLFSGGHLGFRRMKL
jgi:hypothetical protein